MLSTTIRLKVEFLCSCIERSEPVSLSDMTWLQKWARSHRTVHDMLSRSRRRAATGPVDPQSMDGLMDSLNIGDPDESAHITGASSVDELADFFRAPDWTQRD